jgi:hypothetical protein
MADTPFEIPRTMRDLAEQNVKHAHAAYEQLNDFVTKATDAWIGALPSNGIARGFKGVQERTIQIVKENAESAFAHAGKLAQAQNFPEVVTLQTQFAQDRTKAFAAQVQELVKLAGEAFQRSARS